MSGLKNARYFHGAIHEFFRDKKRKRKRKEKLKGGKMSCKHCCCKHDRHCCSCSCGHCSCGDIECRCHQYCKTCGTCKDCGTVKPKPRTCDKHHIYKDSKSDTCIKCGYVRKLLRKLLPTPLISTKDYVKQFHSILHRYPQGSSIDKAWLKRATQADVQPVTRCIPKYQHQVIEYMLSNKVCATDKRPWNGTYKYGGCNCCGCCCCNIGNCNCPKIGDTVLTSRSCLSMLGLWTGRVVKVYHNRDDIIQIDIETASNGIHSYLPTSLEVVPEDILYPFSATYPQHVWDAFDLIQRDIDKR